MGWDVPWYSALASRDELLAERQVGLFHLVCYLRDGDRVFETYWTMRRGAEAMDYAYALMDLTVYGRQEQWEDSPPGWPQETSNTRTEQRRARLAADSEWPGGRPIAQWPRLAAGRLTTSRQSSAGARSGRRADQVGPARYPERFVVTLRTAPPSRAAGRALTWARPAVSSRWSRGSRWPRARRPPATARIPGR